MKLTNHFVIQQELKKTLKSFITIIEQISQVSMLKDLGAN